MTNQHVHKRSAPPPLPVSREGMRHAVETHLASCGEDYLRPVYCGCGEHGQCMAQVCPACGDLVLLLVRRDSWCDCAQAAWAITQAPMFRWWG